MHVIVDMRLLVVLGVVAGCTKAAPEPPPRVADAGVVDSLIVPVIVDAAPIDADPVDRPIDVPVLAMAGPYKSLEASCAAARPCGELTMDPQGIQPPKLPTEPDCRMVLDPTEDPTARAPGAFANATVGGVELVHAIPGGELRIGGVRCAIPENSRGESFEDYVFVRRADGWWRTQLPVFEHSYNEKYCNAGMYMMWNTKGARTILGLAGSRNCMTCSKQLMSEDVTELMIRIESGGAKPRVFAPLLVGLRTRTDNSLDTSPSSWAADCKLGATATSLKETWPTDNEVVLSGPAAAAGGPLDKMFTVGSADITQLARAGHYRFR